MGNSESNSRNDQVPPEKPGDSSSNSRDIKGSGGCKESYTGLEDGADEAEKKQEKLFWARQECMEAHSDYYQPILSARAAFRKAAWKDLLPSTAGRDIRECMVEAKVKEETAKHIEFMERGACSESFRAWND
ncbi:uncharacterized protein LOC112084009 [Eutrema salsugineum]|uniref:uncharacterized protein LOC112084009 n=1 Tax=Eutrema salsugineum TaxID=72664 RepID=UPI000CECFD9F|nr:uncharacterized protein LOC112084009 [Eutrema salsugineum]